jgi:hypothetical protein
MTVQSLIFLRSISIIFLRKSIRIAIVAVNVVSTALIVAVNSVSKSDDCGLKDLVLQVATFN